MNEARNIPDNRLKDGDEVVELRELRDKFVAAIAQFKTAHQREVALAIFDGLADDKNKTQIADSLGVRVAEVDRVWDLVCRSHALRFMSKSLLHLREFIHGRLDLEKMDLEFARTYERIGELLAELIKKTNLTAAEQDEYDLLNYLNNPFILCRRINNPKDVEIAGRIMKKFGLNIPLGNRKWAEGFMSYKRKRIVDKLSEKGGKE